MTQYRAIVLELIEERPRFAAALRANRTMMLTLDVLAGDLKAGHATWTAEFLAANPGSDRRQMASDALEFAIEDLRDRLAIIALDDTAAETTADTLEEVMAYLRPRTPTA